MPGPVRMREDYAADGLRALARDGKDGRQSSRLIALAAVLEGCSRAEAARRGGMDRQTLRDWVHRFNAAGPAGLVDRQAPGSAPRLSAAQRADLATLVRRGPDPEQDGRVRWRRVDLQQEIQRRFGVHYHERHVSRLLHELGFSHISARPRPVGQRSEDIATFKKTSPTRSKPS